MKQEVKLKKCPIVLPFVDSDTTDADFLLQPIRFRKVTYPKVESNKYLISEYGHLYNLLTNSLVIPNYDKDGYQMVNPSGVTVAVHRLVAYQFVDQNSLWLTVNHKDGNKSNNYYQNLEWVTSRYNTYHAIKTGLRNNNGENNPRAVYNEELVRQICELLEKKYRIIDIFRELTGKSLPITNEDKALYQFLYKVHTKKTWTHISKEYNFESNNPGYDLLTPDDLHYICKLIMCGARPVPIAKSMGIDKDNPRFRAYTDMISKISLGKSHLDYAALYFDDQHSNPKIQWINRIYCMTEAGFEFEEICDTLNVSIDSDKDLLTRRKIQNHMSFFITIMGLKSSDDLYIDKEKIVIPT